VLLITPVCLGTSPRFFGKKARCSLARMDRVLERARRGPARTLVGAKEEHLRELHADDTSVREIATALGSRSRSSVVRSSA